MSLPRCSIVISSYNRPRLIRDALDSVFEQEGVELQVIVADDWSDARVHDVLMEYDGRAQRAGLRFGVVRPPSAPTMEERQRVGRCAICINAALRHATGDFLAFLPDDDWLVPGSLAVRANYLVAHPEVNAVYGRMEACKVAARYAPWRHGGIGDLCAAYYLGVRMPEGYTKPIQVACEHDRDGFWSAEPIERIANRADHSMLMVRRRAPLPPWPEYPTGAHRIDPPLRAKALNTADAALCEVEDRDLADDWFDCPDAGWFFRLDLAGYGPFHSVPDVVVVKRFHAHGHLSDPTVRE